MLFSQSRKNSPCRLVDNQNSSFYECQLHRFSHRRETFAIMILLFFLLFLSFNGQVHLSDSEIWSKAVGVHKSLYHRHADSFVELLTRITKDSSLNITSSCRYSLNYWSQGLRNGKSDATLLFDSCGFGGPGSIMRLIDLGHYKQCLSTRLNGTIPSRYVLLETHWPAVINELAYSLTGSWSYEIMYGMKASNYLKHIHALCIPNICIESDIQTVIDSTHVRKLINPLNVTIFSHETEGEDYFVEVRTVRKFAQTVVSGFLTLSIVGTIANLVGIPLLQTFDALRHHRELMKSVKSNSMPENFAFFKVFRALYAIITIFCHSIHSTNATAMFMDRTFFYMSVRDRLFLKSYDDLAHTILVLVMLISSCLTFFMISPVLHKLSIRQMIFLRAIKFIPITAFMLIVILACPISDQVGQGPSFLKIHLDTIMRCLKTGLYQLFFASNFFNFRHLAIPILWIQAADVQCFLLSLGGIWVLKKFKSSKLFFLSLSVQVIIGNILFYRQLNQETRFPLGMAFAWSSSNLAGHQVLATTWSTIGWISIYPVGFALGYLLINNPGINRKPPIMMSIISIIGLLGTTLIREEMYDTHTGKTWMSRTWEVLFISQSRLLIAVFAAMTIYFWFSRSQTVIRMAGHPVVSMISRLSFPAFLTHCITIPAFRGSLTTVSELDRVPVDGLYCLIVSFGWAYLLVILVESPLRKLTKMLLSPSDTQDKKSTNRNKDNGHLDRKNNMNEEANKNIGGWILNHEEKCR